MKIIAPFKLYDKVMLTYNRIQGYVNSIEGKIDINGNIDYNSIRIGIKDNSSTTLLEYVKTEPTNSEITLNNILYNIGQEVIYLDDNSYKQCVLQKGKVEGIEFIKSVGYEIFYYKINGQFHDRYNVYKNRENFINRTKPTRELKENEKYKFTKYLIQQNKLEPINIKPLTKIHCIDDRGEKYRRSNLYSSQEKFINKFTAQI